MEFFKLIRYKNVLFVILTEVLIYWSVIVPTLNIYGLQTRIPVWVIYILIIATALIIAGGYVINDYFDIKTDKINRPDNLIITKTIQKHNAMRFYQILTGMGVLLGIISAVTLRSITLGLIFLIVPGMLWFYSASYKRQLLIGNIIVAVIASLVPIIPLIAESAAISNYYNDLIKQTPILYKLYAYVCGFSVFSFLLTLIHEIIKDIQDEPGDRELEFHTIPVVWGNNTAKSIVTVLFAVTNILAAYTAFYLISFPGSTTTRYYLFSILVPSICAIAILWSNSCTAIKNTATLTNFIMLTGVLYTIIYYYLTAQIHHIPFFGIFQII